MVPVMLVVFPLIIWLIHRNMEGKKWIARGFSKAPNSATKRYWAYMQEGMSPSRAKKRAEDTTLVVQYVVWTISITLIVAMVVANFATFPLGLVALIVIKYINGGKAIIEGKIAEVEQPKS